MHFANSVSSKQGSCVIHGTSMLVLLFRGPYASASGTDLASVDSSGFEVGAGAETTYASTLTAGGAAVITVHADERYAMVGVIAISVDTGGLMAVTLCRRLDHGRPTFAHGTNANVEFPADVALAAMFVAF